MSILSDKHFHNEAAAYRFIEARIWADNNGKPVCPHCGSVERISKMKGTSTRIGAYKCYACRKPFTVKVGTVFEASNLPMRHWLQAIFLLASSKKGISSSQLHRTLGCTLKTAWFLSHRIRKAMQVLSIEPMGSGGNVVEADETYFGDKANITTRTKKGKSGHASKRSVVSLVERGGQARTFHVARADQQTVGQIVLNNVSAEARLHTDESRLYAGMGEHFAEHSSVRHASAEWTRGDVHTNTVEGYFSVFKRGMKGTYQHCSEKNLHRYIAEFDFRYNHRVALGVDDTQRAEGIIKSAFGKRLKYRDMTAK